MDFKSLKKNSSLEKLTRAMDQGKPGGNLKREDDRFWVPEVDKAGNGFAVIRFLDAPAVDGEDGLPWVQVFSHGFQGPGGWYIENSLTTIGKNDPVSEYNTQLWNSGIEANKEIARKQKRKLTYYSNILVVSDPKRPENEGKVFLYKYGKKIFDKIQEKLSPQFEGEKPVNPFDFWKGCNLKLKIRNVMGYRNYDASEWEPQSSLFDGDDAQIEALWKRAYSLKGFVAADQFKSYDELKAKLNKVLGAGGVAGAVAAKTSKIEEEDVPWDKTEPATIVKPKKTAESVSFEDDEDINYFEKLANE